MRGDFNGKRELALYACSGKQFRHEEQPTRKGHRRFIHRRFFLCLSQLSHFKGIRTGFQYFPHEDVPHRFLEKISNAQVHICKIAPPPPPPCFSPPPPMLSMLRKMFVLGVQSSMFVFPVRRVIVCSCKQSSQSSRCQGSHSGAWAC